MEKQNDLALTLLQTSVAVSISVYAFLVFKAKNDLLRYMVVAGQVPSFEGFMSWLKLAPENTSKWWSELFTKSSWLKAEWFKLAIKCIIITAILVLLSFLLAIFWIIGGGWAIAATVSLGCVIGWGTWWTKPLRLTYSHRLVAVLALAFLSVSASSVVLIRSEPHSRLTALRIIETSLVAVALIGFVALGMDAYGRRSAEISRTKDRVFGFEKIFALGLVAIPSLGLIMVMRDQYVPAVFTMALVAIVVAADHDASLEEAPEQILSKVIDSLEGAASDFEEHVTRTSNEQQAITKEMIDLLPPQVKRDLMEAAESFNQHVAKTSRQQGEEIQRMVEQLSTVEDNYRWFDTGLKFLEENRTLRRLTAVVRQWEMDLDWLVITDKEPFRGNLYECLRRIQEFRLTSAELADAHDVDRTLYARFISEGPGRISIEEDSNEINVRFIIGLIYALTLILRVATDTAERIKVQGLFPLPAQIRIGNAPIWVHVIDDSVYQIIQPRTLVTTFARPLHVLFNRGERTHQFASSYEDTIIDAYDRSVRAERYVAGMLLSTEYPREPGDTWKIDNLDSLKEILRRLGADDGDVTFLLFREACIEQHRLGGSEDKMLTVIQAVSSSGWTERFLAKFTELLTQYLVLRYECVHYGMQRPEDKLSGREKLMEEGALRQFLLDEVAA